MSKIHAVALRAGHGQSIQKTGFPCLRTLYRVGEHLMWHGGCVRDDKILTSFSDLVEEGTSYPLEHAQEVAAQLNLPFIGLVYTYRSKYEDNPL